MEALTEGVLLRWFTPAADPATVDRFRAMLLAMPAQAYARYCDMLADADVTERLRAVETPTLVVAGLEDPAVPREAIQALVGGIPDARLVEIAGAAHLANVEQPEVFNRALRELVLQ